jgi:hypothetical protein
MIIIIKMQLTMELGLDSTRKPRDIAADGQWPCNITTDGQWWSGFL